MADTDDRTRDESEEESDEMAKAGKFEDQVFRELGRGYAHMTDEEVGRNVQSRIEAARARAAKRKGK